MQIRIHNTVFNKSVFLEGLAREAHGDPQGLPGEVLPRRAGGEDLAASRLLRQCLSQEGRTAVSLLEPRHKTRILWPDIKQFIFNIQ
jgi:hypothetical protein